MEDKLPLLPLTQVSRAGLQLYQGIHPAGSGVFFHRPRFQKTLSVTAFYPCWA